MIRLTEIRLPLEHPEPALRAAVLARLGIADAALRALTVFKRGYDARKRAAIVFVYTLDCEVDDEAAVLARHAGDPHVRPAPDTRYRFVAQAPADFAASAAVRPVVVGFGPCGLFAALLLAQMGLRPIVLERGRAVRERTRDTWGLWRRGVLDPESNVQFGEGGAGTFSDGKLWSQISDPRHLTRKVIEEFVKAGAPEEIAWVAKPHIGTFRLVGVVEKMRAEIERLGGEIRFGARVVDLRIESGRVRGLTIARGAGDEATTEELRADQVVLALGHSARDTFAMLHERGVAMQAKPFSIGFRIEHPQGVIDRARFGEKYAGHPLLGAADYKLVHHAKQRPLGLQLLHVPGRHGRRRDLRAGPGGDQRHEPVLAQRAQRQRRHRRRPRRPRTSAPPARAARSARSTASPSSASGNRAPTCSAARPTPRRDSGSATSSPGAPRPRSSGCCRRTSRACCRPTSPRPATRACRHYAIAAIREALPAFAKQIAGFAMEDAVLTGVETRTSSPLRMPRGKDLQSTNVAGLYPAGEGAGYAGGIMSAAVDGIEVAEAVARAVLGERRPD